MWDDFIWLALVAGVGVASVAGVLGCFVVWQRMAYFGDSLAHSALLGVALGLAFGVNLNAAIILVGFAFALMLVWLQQIKMLATDTLLGMLAHAALAFGLIAVSVQPNRNIDLQAYLFGDIFTVTVPELLWLGGGGAVVLILLGVNWQALILTTINEDLARAENINTLRLRLLLMFLMAIVVAVSIRVVGIFLITSLLIIPAAAARQITQTPETMALAAALLGVVSVFFGIGASVEFDIPAAPAIVAVATLLFVVLTLAILWWQRRGGRQAASD